LHRSEYPLLGVKRTWGNRIFHKAAPGPAAGLRWGDHSVTTMPVVRPTSHDHGTRHTTAHLLYLGLSLCVGLYRENVPCAPWCASTVACRAPREFGKAELPEIPSGFRYATLVSVLYWEGVPVGRYRQLMTVCDASEMRRQGYS
jgi:hypothetical protein